MGFFHRLKNGKRSDVGPLCDVDRPQSIGAADSRCAVADVLLLRFYTLCNQLYVFGCHFCHFEVLSFLLLRIMLNGDHMRMAEMELSCRSAQDKSKIVMWSFHSRQHINYSFTDCTSLFLSCVG